ncbi:MAG TPA: MFS transporter, partial [Caulobacteraceae bacterium]|nr:MFS transporter [Caulobacteraceae bacterium]
MTQADTPLVAVDAPAAPEALPAVVLPTVQRTRILVWCGVLLLLLNLAAPYAGMIGIPVVFFLKNRLHLSAHALAQFNLWVGIPLYLSFVFGFLRDRWSPFGAGDRGHLIVFGALSAAIYAVIAFVNPTYGLLLAGLLIVTASVQQVAGAANALVSAVGQRHLMAGQASTVFNIASMLPAVAAFFGGLLSDALEGTAAVTAARILFLGAAGFMAAIGLIAAFGPRWLFAETAAQAAAPTTSLRRDIARLLRCWPIYPPLIMLILWDFGPAMGTALQYHLANDLHASDAQVGAFYALFFSANVPTLLLYGWLCQRVRLSRLLVGGTLLAVMQMIPLLFVHSVAAALIAAVVMGLMGGLASGAYVDLAIRSCPERLQGTMMMLVVTVYWVAVRFGDLWGTDLYEHQGGFVTAIIASTAVYALILPVLLLAPRRLTAT